jgi:hypothetical protein
MAEEPPAVGGRARTAFMGTSPVPVCRRLQLVAVLLGIVAVLGFLTAGLVAVSPTGEGLDGLLPSSEVDVVGQVRDPEGLLVQEATVTYEAKDLSSTTGVAGWYFLEGVDSGKVVLTMEAEGFKTVKKTVHMERGTYTVDFLAEPGSGTEEVEGNAIAKPADTGAGAWLMTIGVVMGSVFALVGAYASYSHKWYHLVIIGCLLGILTWGWFVGSAMALVGLVIVLPLKREFGRKDLVCDVPWHEEPPHTIDDSIEDEEEEEVAEGKAIEVSPSEEGEDEGGEVGGMPPGKW